MQTADLNALAQVYKDEVQLNNNSCESGITCKYQATALNHTRLAARINTFYVLTKDVAVCKN